MKTLFVAILLYFSLFSYGQISREYAISIRNVVAIGSTATATYCLTLFSNNRYIMRIHEKSDMFEELHSDFFIPSIETIFPISSGEYEIIDSTLFLSDIYTKAVWIYQLNYPHLEPIQAAPYIKGVLTIDSEKEIDYLPWKRSIDQWYANSTTIDEKTSAFSEKSQENIFQCGLYYGHFFPLGMSFCYFYFDDNSHFDLFLTTPYIKMIPDTSAEYKSYLLDNAVILASGTWERNGNVLELYDSALKHTYFALILADNTPQLLMFLLDSDKIWHDKFVILKDCH